MFKLQLAWFSAELCGLLRMYTFHMSLNACFTVVYLVTVLSRLFWCTFNTSGMPFRNVVKYLPLRGPVMCADFSKPILFALFAELGMFFSCVFYVKVLKWRLNCSSLASLISFNMVAWSTGMLKYLSSKFTRMSRWACLSTWRCRC